MEFNIKVAHGYCKNIFGRDKMVFYLVKHTIF